MPLVLNSSGGGSVTLAAPSTASNVTLTAPAVNANIITNKTPGTILQVISATKTDSFTTTSGTFVDVSGLSVSITPTAVTSKILIISNVNGQGQTSASFLATQLVRNSTAICIADAYSTAIRATASTGYTTDSGGQLNLSMTHLDSPGTTSSITYKVQASTSGHPGQTAYINRSQEDSGGTRSRTTSTITIMEVAA